MLAARIEEAMRNNESLESLTTDNVRRDAARSQITQEKGRSVKQIREGSKQRNSRDKPSSSPPARLTGGKTPVRKSSSSSFSKPRKASSPPEKSSKPKRKILKTVGSRSIAARGKTGSDRRPGKKLSVVGFRGKSSSARAS